MIMGDVLYSTFLPLLSTLVSLLIFAFVIRTISRAAKNASEGQRGTAPEAPEPMADYGYHTAPEEPADSGLGFEIPKMRHAPRIERQTGLYQGGVYHETRPLGNIETLGRQHCAGSEKSSSIEEGRHSCAAAEAPSEYKGERPVSSGEVNAKTSERSGPVFTARDLRAAFVMTEVLGKPKALKRR